MTTLKEKINEIRTEILKLGIKREGTGDGFAFIRLEEIIPRIITLEKEKDIFSLITTKINPQNNGEKPIRTAILEISDIVTKEEISVEMEIIPSMKFDDPMQAIGASQTYARRYLYMLAYNIVESDPIDLEDYENRRNQVLAETVQSQNISTEKTIKIAKKPIKAEVKPSVETKTSKVDKDSWQKGLIKPKNNNPKTIEEFITLGLWLCKGNRLMFKDIINNAFGLETIKDLPLEKIKDFTDILENEVKRRKVW